MNVAMIFASIGLKYEMYPTFYCCVTYIINESHTRNPERNIGISYQKLLTFSNVPLIFIIGTNTV